MMEMREGNHCILVCVVSMSVPINVLYGSISADDDGG